MTTENDQLRKRLLDGLDDPTVPDERYFEKRYGFKSKPQKTKLIKCDTRKNIANRG